jgi:hypothetical protein
MAYTINEHRHRFAAWAACSAASVSGCRFSVQQGKAVLELAGMPALIESPNALPPAEEIDRAHRQRRDRIIEAAKAQGLDFTHGVAAKLLNVYFKSAFVCGGYHDHPSVKALHPPIDSVLLTSLCAQNIGGLRAEWSKAKRSRWSKLTSLEYEEVIDAMRRCSQGSPLWAIEEHWRGYQ